MQSNINRLKGGSERTSRRRTPAGNPASFQDRIDRAILRHSRWAYKARRYQLMDGAR